MNLSVFRQPPHVDSITISILSYFTLLYILTIVSYYFNVLQYILSYVHVHVLKLLCSLLATVLNMWRKDKYLNKL